MAQYQKLEKATNDAKSEIGNFEKTIGALTDRINELALEITQMQDKANGARKQLHAAMPSGRSPKTDKRRPVRGRQPTLTDRELKQQQKESERAKKDAQTAIKAFNKEVAVIEKDIAKKRKEYDKLAAKREKLRSELRKSIK